MPTAPGRSPLPVGRALTLPGRGQTFFRQVNGPEGAPTVLLLHGWLATADLNWLTSFEALGERFSVVAIDHRGHGRGIRSSRPFRLGDCADDAAALVRTLGRAPVIAVGYSMGGAVAQLLWRRHRQLVGGLVLSATSRSFSARDLRTELWFASLLGLSMAARLTPQPVQRGVSRCFIRRRVGADGDEWVLSELERNDPGMVLRAGWELSRFRSDAWVGEIDVPTAVVMTAHDHVVVPSNQLGLATAIPDAVVHEVEAGHGACLTEPERFVPTLVAACSQVAQRAGLSVGSA